MIIKQTSRSYTAQPGQAKTKTPRVGLSVCKLAMGAIIIGVPVLIYMEIGMVMAWLGP